MGASIVTTDSPCCRSHWNLTCVGYMVSSEQMLERIVFGERNYWKKYRSGSEPSLEKVYIGPPWREHPAAAPLQPDYKQVQDHCRWKIVRWSEEIVPIHINKPSESTNLEVQKNQFDPRKNSSATPSFMMSTTDIKVEGGHRWCWGGETFSK